MSRLEYGAFNPDGSFNDELGSPIRASSGIRDSSLSKQAKSVAWALLSRANATEEEEGWSCFPSLGRLQKDTGWGRMAVWRGLLELRAAGLVTWTTGGWNAEEERNLANTYHLDLLAMEGLKGG